MTKRRKSVDELRAENRFLRQWNISNAIASAAIPVAWAIAAVLITRYAFMSVAVLAGKTTLADIGVRFLGDLRVSEVFAWVFGAGGTIYGLRQRKLRRDLIEGQSPYIRELEQRLDPNRTSSRLTARGETAPEDKQ